MEQKKNKRLNYLRTFNHGSVSGAIILDERRALENNCYPVRFRITHNRVVKYYSSGYSFTPDEWDNLPDSRSKNNIETRNLIISGFEFIEGFVKDLKNDFTFELLNIRMGRGKADSVFDVFEAKKNQLYEDGKLNTSDWYKYAAKNLYDFTKKDLKFKDITVNFLNKYEKWLIENKKSYTSISMYMRALQSIVNEGIKQGYLSKNLYPFGKDKDKYQIPSENTRKLALTLAQIKQVLDYPLVTENELRCRDLWFFSYLCNGANIVDILQLKYSDISNGEVSFYRQKTITKTKNKQKIYATVVPEMETIINKWGNPDRKPGNYIFPILKPGLTPVEILLQTKNTTHLINDKMTKIGLALGIGKITTYTARHSYATVLKRSGANISYISESLGHTDLSTTENYLASFEADERKKNSGKLTAFIE